MREARRGTATIFQDHALIDRLPAIDNVLLGLADMRHPLSPLPWPRALRIRAATALDEVGLLSRATARTGQLSGGERQRVGIARALVRRPRLLLGDEPFASVDPVLARELGAEFRRLVVHYGLTVIVVLHQLPLARTLADRIVGLAAGRVAFDGPAADFDADAEDAVFSSATHSTKVNTMPVRLSRRFLFAGAWLAAGLAPRPSAQDRPKKLVVGLLPGEFAPTVMRLNEPLRAYLEKRLGIPVELAVGADYAATGEALRFGRLDIAFLGPVTYILRSRSAKLEPFARPSHAVVGPTFTAVVIVPADSRARLWPI